MSNYVDNHQPGTAFVIPIRYAESSDPDAIDIAVMRFPQSFGVRWQDVVSALDQAWAKEREKDRFNFEDCLDAVAAAFGGSWYYEWADLQIYVIGG